MSCRVLIRYQKLSGAYIYTFPFPFNRLFFSRLNRLISICQITRFPIHRTKLERCSHYYIYV